MPVAEVCRLTAESGEPAVHRVRRRRLAGHAHAGCSRPRSRSPSTPPSSAVICDERAHPRMQPLAGLTVLTVGTLDDLSGLLLRGATA